MNEQQFQKSFSNELPPAGLSIALQALWMEHKGDWDAAHQLVQSSSGYDSAWVHAYLHRKEGDFGNASYWYSRAGKTMPKASFDQEWQTIVGGLLDQES